jgi:hypothetical protein
LARVVQLQTLQNLTGENWAMSTVTVLGAHSQIFTLTYETAANAALARQLAAAITASVKDGTLLPAVDTDGPPPTLPSGAAGQFV